MLGALGSLIGGAAGVAKAVNDGKAARRQLEELQRHNRAIEGRGLYLAPYARGRGTVKRISGDRRKKKSSVDARITIRCNDGRATRRSGQTTLPAVLSRCFYARRSAGSSASP